MGYMFAGHVVTAEPDTQTLEPLGNEINWAVYKHNEMPLWMLDTFERRFEDHEPFGDLPVGSGPDRLSEAAPE